MNNYELMVIFTPVLSEEDFKGAQKKYEDFIAENGGSTVHSNPWGLKSLAYPIQKKTTGIYWVLEFTGAAEVIEKLKIQYYVMSRLCVIWLHVSINTPSSITTPKEMADLR